MRFCFHTDTTFIKWTHSVLGCLETWKVGTNHIVFIIWRTIMDDTVSLIIIPIPITISFHLLASKLVIFCWPTWIHYHTGRFSPNTVSVKTCILASTLCQILSAFSSFNALHSIWNTISFSCTIIIILTIRNIFALFQWASSYSHWNGFMPKTFPICSHS